MKYPAASAWSKRIPGTVFMMLLISMGFMPLNAQRQTYFGVGLTFASTTSPNDKNIFHLTNNYILDGGGYNVTIRQEINDFLSLKTGISSLILSPDMIHQDHYFGISFFFAHTIPLQAELEVDLLKDRIAFYGSAGVNFTVREVYDPETNYTVIYLKEARMKVSRNYLTDGSFHVNFTAGTGFRFRLFDELYFDLELGYASHISDLVAYHFTWMPDTDDAYSFTWEDPLDYWYIRGGFSYSIQRVVQGVRALADWYKTQDVIVIE